MAEKRCGIWRRLASWFGGEHADARTGADGVAAFGGAVSVELAKQGESETPETPEVPGEDESTSAPPIDTASGSSYAMLEFKPHRHR